MDSCFLLQHHTKVANIKTVSHQNVLCLIRLNVPNNNDTNDSFTFLHKYLISVTSWRTLLLVPIFAYLVNISLRVMLATF